MKKNVIVILALLFTGGSLLAQDEFPNGLKVTRAGINFFDLAPSDDTQYSGTFLWRLGTTSDAYGAGNVREFFFQNSAGQNALKIDYNTTNVSFNASVTIPGSASVGGQLDAGGFALKRDQISFFDISTPDDSQYGGSFLWRLGATSDQYGPDPDRSFSISRQLGGNSGLEIKFDDLTVIANEKLAVGTTAVPGDFKFAVDGKGIAEELQVKLSGDWPDYVFEDAYQLPSLAEVNTFINKNKHLPGIPSSAEVADKGGIELGEMNRKLVEKVEEIMLYLIDQEARIQALEKENAELKARLNK